MEYKIISYVDDKSYFERLVKKSIDEGWKPQGGVCVEVTRIGAFYYYQAMVKESK